MPSQTWKYSAFIFTVVMILIVFVGKSPVNIYYGLKTATLVYLGWFAKKKLSLCSNREKKLCAAVFCFTIVLYFTFSDSLNFKGLVERHTRGRPKFKFGESEVVLEEVVPGNETAKAMSSTGSVIRLTDPALLTCTPLNITSCPRPHLLPNIKNACFLTTVNGEEPSIHCLPSLFVPGFTKAGTTQMFSDLKLHPHILKRKKETHWFDGWMRRGVGVSADARHVFRPLTMLIQKFHEGTEHIERCYYKYLKRLQMLFKAKSEDLKDSNRSSKISFRRETTKGCGHDFLLMDGTPRTVWDGDHWNLEERNKDLEEPKELIPQKIYHLNPKAKFIIMLRNPIERLLSDYHFYLKHKAHPRHHVPPSAADFHAKVKGAIQWWENCTRVYSEKRCAYGYHYPLLREPPGDPTLMQWGCNCSSADRLRVSLYYLYVREFMKVFPRDQFLFVKSEEYKMRRIKILIDRVYPFVGVQPLSSKTISVHDLAAAKKQRNSYRGQKIQMYRETREMLAQFFAPYNYKLATILNDPTFTWK